MVSRELPPEARKRLAPRTGPTQTIQVDIDDKLLDAIDRAGQNAKRKRSELILQALREHLQRSEIRDLQDRDRQGYFAHPSKLDGSVDWEAEASWPPESPPS